MEIEGRGAAISTRETRPAVFANTCHTDQNIDAPLSPEGTRFLPGTQGGTNWYGPSYAPSLYTLVVPSIDWATVITLGGAESLQHDPPTPFVGSSNGFGDEDPKDQRFGHITAVDADSGTVLWKG